MADKTPPYVPDDFFSLEEETSLRSPKVVRTNSSFCQSLLREMSENSLLLLSKVKETVKDCANSKSYVLESKENSDVIPDMLSQLMTRKSNGSKKTSISETMFDGQTDKEPVEVSSNGVEPELSMEKFSGVNQDISSEELEVLSRNSSGQTPSNEVSLKRSRNQDEESGDPSEKRARVSTTQTGEADQGTESSNNSLTATAPATLVVPSNETMADPKVNSTTSLSEDMLNERTTKTEAVIPEAKMSNEASVDATSEVVEKSSQLDQEQIALSATADNENPRNPSSITVLSQETEKDEYSNDGKCSICGKLNCPLDPKRSSKMSPVFVAKTSLVVKVKTPKKSKVFQYVAKKPRKMQTPLKRCINTRSLTNGLIRRIANHSPLHIFKLKTQLFKAVENGDLVRVQELIQDTGAAVRRDKTRCTLLHAAASHNQPDVVMFLQKLISPSVTNKDGQTPAHVAAEKGHMQVLKLLVSDSDFDPDKQDNRHNTVKSLLGGHLFKAVLDGNQKQIERLLELGADPDSHGGNLVNGLLARELGVTTPRRLANALNMDSVVTMFDKKRGNDKETDLKSSPSADLNTTEFKVPTRQFNVTHATTVQGGADVYKIDREARGFVGIFNFSSFKKRSDLNLQQLDYDARIMANVFDDMGYRCETHSSLTAQQTKEAFKSIRDGEVLKDVGCAVFAISGYGANGKVLTSDMKCVDIDYILNFFKDSECPQLKNKPKLFIFNLYNMNQVDMTLASETPKKMRLSEPLSNMACVYSNSIGFNCIPNGRGTSFNWALCRTLADHAGDKELGDLYREFLKEYNKSSPSFSPELRYFGFTKKFFFNPM
ncbi:uncharacterized protein LOC122261470 [Penaeus japonicus]|uniref:uncharacterized protein LOC122261470 n=1 Tax=Penaeus japonicus TaxID=27405 RepID=UPI001C715DEA|nr:uncharacterized protein LOC122261470 [Penaeus japonicus]